MSLLLTIIILDLKDIFHFFYDSTGVNTRCRRVVATTTLLAPSALKTSLLVVLVLLAVLALVGRRLFAIRCVSGRGVSKLSPFRVFFLFLGGPVLLRTPGIHLAGT